MILDRLIRQRDAPAYCGMDRSRFDSDVRPDLTEIPIGTRSIAYDRLELDAWIDAYIAAHGRPGRSRRPGLERDLRPKYEGMSTAGTAPKGSSGGPLPMPDQMQRSSENARQRSKGPKLSNYEKAMARFAERLGTSAHPDKGPADSSSMVISRPQPSDSTLSPEKKRKSNFDRAMESCSDVVSKNSPSSDRREPKHNSNV